MNKAQIALDNRNIKILCGFEIQTDPTLFQRQKMNSLSLDLL